MVSKEKRTLEFIGNDVERQLVKSVREQVFEGELATTMLRFVTGVSGESMPLIDKTGHLTLLGEQAFSVYHALNTSRVYLESAYARYRDASSEHREDAGRVLELKTGMMAQVALIFRTMRLYYDKPSHEEKQHYVEELLGVDKDEQTIGRMICMMLVTARGTSEEYESDRIPEDQRVWLREIEAQRVDAGHEQLSQTEMWQDLYHPDYQE